MARYRASTVTTCSSPSCCASRAKFCCGAVAATAAEDSFRKALDIARQQEALLWELRAALSLARLRAKQGRGDEARQLLAQVYDRFTEGFETPDLRAARAFLDEL